MDIGFVQSDKAKSVPTNNANLQPAFSSVLPVGQVVLFDAICVIDTTSTSSVATKSSETESLNKGKEITKLIYMVATKVTKIDDCKIGCTGDITGKLFLLIPTGFRLHTNLIKFIST